MKRIYCEREIGVFMLTNFPFLFLLSISVHSKSRYITMNKNKFKKTDL